MPAESPRPTCPGRVDAELVALVTQAADLVRRAVLVCGTLAAHRLTRGHRVEHRALGTSKIRNDKGGGTGGDDDNDDGDGDSDDDD